MNHQPKSFAGPDWINLGRLALACLVLGLVPGPGGGGARAEDTPADLRFDSLAGEFMTGHYSFRPLAGVALGWHQYDGRLVIPDRSANTHEAARLKRFQRLFAGLQPGQLSLARRHDLRVLGAAVANELWSLEVQHSVTHNPMTYAGGLDLTVYLKRDFKPLPERVADMTSILRQAPAYYAAARANLAPVLPLPFVETAIEAANGTADFIEHDVAKAAATVKDTGLHAKFDQARQAAVTELHGFAGWLKKERLPQADNSFPVGRAGYLQMLKNEMVDLTPEQVLEAGMRELHAEQERFAAAARAIDPTKPPIEVFKSIQHDHPTAANLIADARQDLEGIRQFLLDHHIVTLPSEVRALVEETPPALRATSFASMDTPGPFEKKATEAYYYITPVEPDWTPEHAEEWLTAFNHYTLTVVSIHEAYPGHYVQFLGLNASAASPVAKVFSSYPFVEGWAHYSEQMLLAAGFGQPVNPASASAAETLRGARFRLAQSDEALLRVCRLCCSIKLHCQGMSVAEATKFFMDNCYYEEKPAHAEATRGTYDPGYLYYTLGKLMILKLRADWQLQEGARYSLQRFHDEFLRHGMPPIRLLREIMLHDPNQWPALL